MDSSLLVNSVTVAAKTNLKRPCCSQLLDSTRISFPNPNPNPLDALLESFLELTDSSAIALDISIDRLLELRPCDSDKNDVIERAFRLGSALSEASKRAARRRASMHNAFAWALPSDLTIKDMKLELGISQFWNGPSRHPFSRLGIPSKKLSLLDGPQIEACRRSTSTLPRSGSML
ncbi:hypothetical protein CASFOL_010056 [Castilleja foliolosa]|uniref:Uncharacterized protein n=1 Tax=Castilleja foliolosa TaxID=1961234 RepID=A0ABD3DVL4_9LAMI